MHMIKDCCVTAVIDTHYRHICILTSDSSHHNVHNVMIFYCFYINEMNVQYGSIE